MLGEQQAAPRRHSDNVEAFELYLKGRHLWQLRTQSSLHASIEYFDQAIAVDPNYALAHAGIADSLCILRVYGYVSEKEARSKAHAAAQRAMELDPELAEAHFASALFTLYFSEDWPAGEPALREAVRLSPRNAMFHTYLGFFLAARHRADEAIASLSKGAELDPFSPLVFGLYGASMNMLRRYDEGVRLGERSVEIQSDFHVGLLAVGLGSLLLGNCERAVSVLERLVVHSNKTAWWVGLLGLAYARCGRRDDAIRLRNELAERGQREYVSPYAPLTIDVGLNDRDSAYRSLQACIDERVTGFAIEITLVSCLDPLDDEPRFQELFRRLRLVQPRPKA